MHALFLFLLVEPQTTQSNDNALVGAAPLVGWPFFLNTLSPLLQDDGENDTCGGFAVYSAACLACRLLLGITRDV
jgi:hypothetical protein